MIFSKSCHLFLMAYAKIISNNSQKHPDISVVVIVGARFIAQSASIVKEIIIVRIKLKENIVFCLLSLELCLFCNSRFSLRICDTLSTAFHKYNYLIPT